MSHPLCLWVPLIVCVASSSPPLFASPEVSRSSRYMVTLQTLLFTPEVEPKILECFTQFKGYIAWSRWERKRGNNKLRITVDRHVLSCFKLYIWWKTERNYPQKTVLCFKSNWCSPIKTQQIHYILACLVFRYPFPNLKMLTSVVHGASYLHSMIVTCSCWTLIHVTSTRTIIGIWVEAR